MLTHTQHRLVVIVVVEIHEGIVIFVHGLSFVLAVGLKVVVLVALVIGFFSLLVELLRGVSVLRVFIALVRLLLDVLATGIDQIVGAKLIEGSTFGVVPLHGRFGIGPCILEILALSEIGELFDRHAILLFGCPLGTDRWQSRTLFGVSFVEETEGKTHETERKKINIKK